MGLGLGGLNNGNITLKEECAAVQKIIDEATKANVIPPVFCAPMSCDVYPDELYKIYLPQKDVPK